MNNKPLVTVIIPTYKRPYLVLRAIRSVFRQTHERVEVLVVDDCSPDETKVVVQDIVDQRLRYLRHEVNKGLPAVRNTGIRAARGDYIAFLDDDDEWRGDKLAKQLAAIKNFDAVACTAISTRNGHPMRVHKRTSITLEDLKRGSFSPSGLLVKAHVFQDVLFDEKLRQGEDWDAFIRIAQRYTIGWVSDPLVFYNESAHSRMTNEARLLTGPELEKRAAILYKHRDFLGEKWFNYHLADILLPYISSRSDKIECLLRAVKRCGVRPVGALLLAKLRAAVLRCLLWARRRTGFPSKPLPVVGNRVH